MTFCKEHWDKKSIGVIDAFHLCGSQWERSRVLLNTTDKKSIMSFSLRLRFAISVRVEVTAWTRSGI